MDANKCVPVRLPKTKSSNEQSFKWNQYQYSTTNRFLNFLKKPGNLCKKKHPSPGAQTLTNEAKLPCSNEL